MFCNTEYYPLLSIIKLQKQNKVKTLKNIQNALNTNPDYELFTNEGDNQGAMRMVEFRGNNNYFGLSVSGTTYVTGYGYKDFYNNILKSDWIKIRKK